MNLADWGSLSIGERRNLIIQWREGNIGDDRYQSITSAAAAALRQSLDSNPIVTNVDIGTGKVLCWLSAAVICENVLIVYILLPTGGLLETVPTTFAGFEVQQINLYPKRDAFLKTWKRLFKELKGWDEEQTLSWARKWDNKLTGRELSAVYHYGPIKIAISALVDEPLRMAAEDRLHDLYNRIRAIIEQTENDVSQRVEHPDLQPDYDWESVRARVSEVIRESVN